MGTHSSILAWEILWTEEPGEYGPWGRKRVRQDLVTKQPRQNSPRREDVTVKVRLTMRVFCLGQTQE